MLHSISRGACLLAVLLAMQITSTGAYAQIEGKIVKSIDVQYVGNQTVAPDRIRSQMSTKVGDRLSATKLDADVKSLYKSGDVENVRVLSEAASGGVALIIVVQTRALYSGVEFQGNTFISDKKLGKQLDLSVNKKIDESSIREGREKIQEMYRKKGFPETTVNYRIGAPSAEGYSSVIFTIKEGTQGVLRNIDFVGNSAYSSAELKAVMEQKEKGIKTMFGKGGNTDSASLAEDVHKIEDHYRDGGYLNAKVVNVAKMRVDAKKVDVVISIEEGIAYQVVGVSIKGVSVLSMQDDVMPYLKTEAGSQFSGLKLEKDVKLLGDQYGRRGYADARVVPRLEEAGPGAVKVVINVTEGRPYKIGKIHIEGNDDTFDRVIRRELPLEPGQPLDTTKVDVTKRRLMNMNYFQNVEIMPLDTTYIDEKDLLIRVTEKSTGTVNFGAGFSSIDQVTGFMEITQTNFSLFDHSGGKRFTGGGQRFRLNLRGGSQRADASISITEPWFMQRRLAFTTEAYYRDLQFLSDQYNQKTVGGSFSLRKSLGEFTYGVLSYRAEQIEISPDGIFTSPLFMAEVGTFFNSVVGVDVVNDTRDNFFLPREGHKVSLGFEFAGIGGDVNDTTGKLIASQHFTLPHDVIFNFSGRFTQAANGDHVFTRHNLGGPNNLRGFDYRDVGPRDPVSLEALGGKRAWYTTVEVTAPVVKKIRAALFYDIGEVSDGPAGSVGGGVNSDWGIGLRLFILGDAPVRLDYAFPLQADLFNDSGGRFNFTIGAQF